MGDFESNNILTRWAEIIPTSFSQLSNVVLQTSRLAQTESVKAVNRMATIRNWLIGFYIVEYEQNGSDRAQYGKRLLKNLEEAVDEKGLTATLFYHAREFYKDYPQVKEYLTNVISPTASVKSNKQMSPTASVTLPEKETSGNRWQSSAETLVSRLSFSHIVEILAVKDPQERYFYETECIRCNWSVRELRRQISTKLFVRAGLSKHPETLDALQYRPQRDIRDDVKNPYFFEFLGLKARDVVEEKDLEQALIDNLQQFLLELGKGFCFEARQKRIIIDDEYYYADLVFYHRILHCNVIVELKCDEFRHEYLGQLNAYVSYYRENEMNTGDNPPVGILLCTRKGKKMVEYALAGMDNNLFVSTYLLQLPNRKVLEGFLQNQESAEYKE